MRVIQTSEVENGMWMGLDLLNKSGVTRNSRNGPVVVSPTPVVTTFLNPLKRVVSHPVRDANPFFHYLESLWMLCGLNHIKPLTVLLPSYANYSDDGVTANGAYGYRWRRHFNCDQLNFIVRELTQNPESRRCVLSMWDGRKDLGANSKDLPCNTNIYFWVENDSYDPTLHMTVCNRSNDIIWGLYGANAVHFSVLQEYMAARIGVEVGQYHHLSNNYHAYTENEVYKKLVPHVEGQVALLEHELASGTYSWATTTKLFAVDDSLDFTQYSVDAEFQDEVFMLMVLIENKSLGDVPPRFQFFANQLGYALWSALKIWRTSHNYEEACSVLAWLPEDCDWKHVAEQWLRRRADRFND